MNGLTEIPAVGSEFTIRPHFGDYQITYRVTSDPQTDALGRLFVWTTEIARKGIRGRLRKQVAFHIEKKAGGE